MSMIAMKTETSEVATPPATAAAPVVTMTPKRAPRAETYARLAKETAARVVPPLIVVALLLVVWELICRRAGSSLPPPTKVFKDTKELILDPFFDHGGIDKGLFWHLSASLQRVAYGYSLAAIAGIALGTLVGQSVWAMRGLDPLFQVLRTIPPLAWLPLSLAAFRDGQPSAIFVIFICSVWPMLLNTAFGVVGVRKEWINVARTLEVGTVRRAFTVILPAAAPTILTGMRISIGIAWLVIVAAEMLVGGTGIGYFVWNEWNNLSITNVIIAILLIGLVGMLLDQVLARFTRMVTFPE